MAAQALASCFEVATREYSAGANSRDFSLVMLEQATQPFAPADTSLDWGAREGETGSRSQGLMIPLRVNSTRHGQVHPSVSFITLPFATYVVK